MSQIYIDHAWAGPLLGIIMLLAAFIMASIAQIIQDKGKKHE